MPTPKPGESQKDFVSRCIPIVINDGTAEDEKQAAAICYSKYREKDKMKLETVNVGNMEIFQAGTWKGQKFSEQDIDEIIQNYKQGVIEPYLNINHSEKATDQFKEALKSMSLGFVSDLRRIGNRLIADFKQVPKVIGELIEAGALKKKSIELFKKYSAANGQQYSNVLQAVTVHGGDGVPALNTLNDFVALYKINTESQISESFKNEDFTEENKMEKIEILRDEYNSLVKFKADVEAKEQELIKLKAEADAFKIEFDKLIAEHKEFEKFKADLAKKQAEVDQKEAEAYVDAQIAEGKIIPASKELYVKNYLSFKTDENQMKIFKADIENRNKMIFEGAIKESDSDGKVVFKNTDDLEAAIQGKMKKENITWEAARAKLLGEEVKK